MKFRFKNFLIFGTLFSSVFLLISGIFLLAISNGAENEVPFILSSQAWKVRAIISLLLLLIFLSLFLISIKGKLQKANLKLDSKNKVLISIEFWVALILTIIILFTGSLESSVLKLKSQSANQSSVDNLNNSEALNKKDLRLVSFADLTFDQISDNYQGITGEFVRYKLQEDYLIVDENDLTLRDVSVRNEMPVNELVKIIGYGEILSPYIKNGKKIEIRSIADAEIETGIPSKHIFKIFDKYKVAYSGDLKETFTDLSKKSVYSPEEIYGILLNKEPVSHELKAEANAEKDKFIRLASDMTIKQLISTIKSQQPEAAITSKMAIERLLSNNVQIYNKDAILKDIAKANKVTVDEILKIISFGSKQDLKSSGGTRLDGPPDFIKSKENQEKAKKFIHTPLSKLAVKYDMDINDIMRVLKENNIIAKSDDTIDKIAKENNQRPGPIISILRIERERQIAKKGLSNNQ